MQFMKKFIAGAGIATMLIAGSAHAGDNPCAMKANPCAAKGNPCAMKSGDMKSNPCAAKKHHGHKKAANPCAGKNPCAAKK